MATIKVVIADDHRLMIEAVRCVLDAAGDFEVVGEATSGAQVLPIVSRTNPDVVVLDLRMPGADGLKCLDWLRSRHESVYHALAHAIPAGGSPAQEAGLTPSEQRVLEALARGLTNKEIARELWLTEQTVKFHLTRIYRRLGVGNRTEAVRHAYQNRLVSHPFYEPA